MSAVNRFRSLLKGRCPHCGYHFEKEPGFFVGAMYASYALTLAESFTVYLLIRYFTTAPALLVLIIVSVVGPLPLINFRYSRILWMYAFTRRGEPLDRPRGSGSF